jgi:hypothetical protein
MLQVLCAARSAVPRFLIGSLGTWCTIAPIIFLINGFGSASSAAIAGLLVLLLVCYIVAFVIFLHPSGELWKEFVSETVLAMCFIIVGLLINDLTGFFIAIKHELAVVYPFVGFFIAESVKTSTHLKSLRERLLSGTQGWIHF